MNMRWDGIAGGTISVEIRAPGQDLHGPWESLAARTSANAFMHPAALAAAAETGFSKVHVLLAFDDGVAPRRPVGFWALRERRHFRLTPAFLETLPFEYAFSSNAVIDPDRVDDVVAAFFEAIRTDPRLPKTVTLRSIEADPVVYPAILRHLGRKGRHREMFRTDRPFVDLGAGIKKNGSVGKKQRQDLRKLHAMGITEFVNDRTQAAVVSAFETFLQIEAASWKGEQGTALLSNADDARFVRRLVADLAARGLASVALLSVGGEAIAALVLFYSGRLAYTWKIAFRSSHARYSPGALLISRVADELLASGEIDAVDSCSSAEGFISRLWTGRRTLVDVMACVEPGRASTFALQLALQRSQDLVREARRRIQMAAKRTPGPKPPAT